MTDAQQRTIELPHLSFTQLRTFVDCPRRWHYQKVARVEPERMPVALALGIAVHESIAAVNEAALTGDPVDAAAVFRAAWRTQATQPVPLALSDTDDPAALEAKGAAVVAVYTPPPRIIAVEQAITVVLADDLPPLQGRIDLIRQNEHGDLVVADVKTSSTRQLGEVEPVAAQLALYDVAYPAASHEAIVLFKGATPSQLLQEIRPWPHQQLVRWVREIAAAMQAGVRYSHRTRSCSSCPYRDRCRRDG